MIFYLIFTLIENKINSAVIFFFSFLDERILCSVSWVLPTTYLVGRETKKTIVETKLATFWCNCLFRTRYDAHVIRTWTTFKFCKKREFHMTIQWASLGSACVNYANLKTINSHLWCGNRNTWCYGSTCEWFLCLFPNAWEPLDEMNPTYSMWNSSLI